MVVKQFRTFIPASLVYIETLNYHLWPTQTKHIVRNNIINKYLYSSAMGEKKNGTDLRDTSPIVQIHRERTPSGPNTEESEFASSITSQ